MYLSWLIVSVLSFLLGVCIVEYLTIHPLQMNWYLLLVCLFTFGLVLLLIMRFEHWERLIALCVSLLCVLAGYAFMTRILHNIENPSNKPELTRAQHDPGNGHYAVIYFAHGEPETYNPIGWIHTFNEFDETGVRFMPFLVRPYFLHLLRK